MFTTNSSKWLTCTISCILVSSYTLATSFKIYAGTVPTAKAVRVDRIRNNGNNKLEQIQIGITNGRDTWTAEKGQLLENRNRFLWIPGNGSEATLQYISRSGSTFGPGVLAISDKNPSTYFFPCTLQGGSFIVGWSRGDGEDRQCVPPGITVKRNRGNRSSQLLNQDTFLFTQGLKNLLTAQSSRNQMFRYCTVAAKKRGWWIRWGTFDDPCEEANQECLTTGSASGCQVVGLGEWRIKDRDLLVSVECANDQVFADRGNGQTVATSLISDLAERAKNDKSKACVLNVYQPDDVIVLPATKKVTLIQTHDFGDTLAIDALAGDVIIKSAKHSTGVLLKAGNRYIYPNDKVIFQPINVSEIAKSPAIQSFLNPNNWSPDAAAQLEDYRRAIQSKKPSPGKNGILKTLPAIAILGLFGLIDLIDNDDDSDNRGNNSTNNRNERTSTPTPIPTPTPTPTPTTEQPTIIR